MEDLLTEGGATEQETKLFMKQLAEVRVQLAPKIASLSGGLFCAVE
jgi:hypothetical protein